MPDAAPIQMIHPDLDPTAVIDDADQVLEQLRHGAEMSRREACVVREALNVTRQRLGTTGHIDHALAGLMDELRLTALGNPLTPDRALALVSTLEDVAGAVSGHHQTNRGALRRLIHE